MLPTSFLENFNTSPKSFTMDSHFDYNFKKESQSSRVALNSPGHGRLFLVFFHLGLDNHWHLWLPYALFREMALVAEAQGQAKQWPKGQGGFKKRKWFAGLGVIVFPSKISTYHFFSISKN